MSILLGAHCTSESRAPGGAKERKYALSSCLSLICSRFSLSKIALPARAGPGLAEQRGLGPRRRASYPLVPATCAIYENHRQTRKRKRSTKRHPARTAVYHFLSHPRTKEISRKEVFQPHLPVRLHCYDLAPITGFALGRPSRLRTSGAPGFHGLTGGVYKARERIHRAMADARLLANPASRSRVADSDPN